MADATGSRASVSPERSRGTGKPTRDGFGEALLELGAKDPRIVALSGDLEDSARAKWFKDTYPERFFSVGIAEQDLIGTAVGLALAGKIPFACSFSAFVTGKSWEQIRVAVCYQQANVKIVGSHGGLSVGADGATAEALEDVSIMRALPHMTVIVPADATEAAAATRAIAAHHGPVYLRVGRAPTPVITSPEAPFVIGQAARVRAGGDVTLIACGTMVAFALRAAELLAAQGIGARVLNMATIKPIDAVAVRVAAGETGAIVTVEEHNVIGALGSAVAEVVTQEQPVPVCRIGVQDRFGTSGDPSDLYKAFHLMPEDIAAATAELLRAKRASLR